MIRKNIKQNKGITLISMILAIIVIFIIISAISYSSINSFKVRNLQNLFSDIDTLDDAISVYYIKNGDLPVYYSSYNFNGNECEYQPFAIKNTIQSSSTYLKFREKNRNNSFISYGILDATKLNNVNLNKVHNVPDNIDGGKFFQNKSTDEKNLKSSISSGIYVINLDTHKVYYTKGVSSDGKMYYTKDDDNSSTIYSYTKQEDKTIEQTELDQGKEENTDPYVTVKFWANGGVGVPDSMKVYFSDTDSETEKKLSSLLSGYPPPGRTGMTFLGYSTSSSGSTIDDVQIYYYSQSVASGYASNNGDNIFIKKEDCGKEINVYAIWGENTSNLIYYYDALEAEGTSGGINPSLNQDEDSLSRSSNIPDGVSNYLCVSIPSSGYTISWKWDNSQKNETKEAVYDGDSKKNNVINGNKYTTTENGVIKIKGSFTDLQVVGDNNTKKKFFQSSATRILKVYGTSDRKDKAGTILKDSSNKDIEWMTGEDRSFTIPVNMLSYKNLGIKDRLGKDLYATNPDSKDEYYYIKKVIVTDTDSAQKEGNNTEDAIEYNKNATNKNYVYGAYDLGESVILPASSEKTYCFYAYFGAKNYKITSSDSANNGQKYYHEDLNEALDDAVAKKFDKIEIMDNVNTQKAIDYIKKTTDSDKYYIENYDPTYAKDIYLNSYGNNISLDFKSYELRRKGSIAFFTINLIGSGNNASLKFIDSDSNEHNDETSNYNLANTKILIQGNVIIKNLSIESNTQNNNIIRLNGTGYSGSSSLKLLDGTTITNTNYVENKENPAIISMTSNSQTLYLGCESSEELDIKNRTKDSNIKITNSNGYCIDLREPDNLQYGGGNIFWNYGILSTYNYKYKAGYILNSDNFEHIHTANENKAFPCIYASGKKYNNNDIINIKLDEKIWTWSDSDSGESRNYATNSLQNAHDLMNLSNKLGNVTLTRNNDFVILKNDIATITKDVILDFNSESSELTVINSNLTIQAKVNITNYYGTTNSKISVTGEGSELHVLKSIITGNTSDYTIENLDGAKVYLGSGGKGSNVPTIKGKGVYSNSELNINRANIMEVNGVALTLTGGNCKIFNESTISGTKGINLNGTGENPPNLTILANATMDGANNTTDLTIIESTGTKTDDYAISVESGTLTLGKNETPVNLNKFIPTIKSKNIGIKLDSRGTLNFYDGCINSISKKSIQANGTSNPTSGSGNLRLPNNNYKITYSDNYNNTIENKTYTGKTAHLETK